MGLGGGLGGWLHMHRPAQERPTPVMADKTFSMFLFRLGSKGMSSAV